MGTPNPSSVRDRWRGAKVTVDVWDLHVLLAFAHSTGRAEVLDREDIASLNRLVEASNAAKAAPVTAPSEPVRPADEETIAT